MIANASHNYIFMFQLVCGLVNDFFFNVQNMHTKQLVLQIYISRTG